MNSILVVFRKLIFIVSSFDTLHAFTFIKNYVCNLDNARKIFFAGIEIICSGSIWKIAYKCYPLLIYLNSTVFHQLKMLHLEKCNKKYTLNISLGNYFSAYNGQNNYAVDTCINRIVIMSISSSYPTHISLKSNNVFLLIMPSCVSQDITRLFHSHAWILWLVYVRGKSIIYFHGLKSNMVSAFAYGKISGTNSKQCKEILLAKWWCVDS